MPGDINDELDGGEDPTRRVLRVTEEPDWSGIYIEDCLIKELEAPYLSIPGALNARNITIRNCSIKPNGRGGILIQSRSDD
jgi:hypothetical protein